MVKTLVLIGAALLLAGCGTGGMASGHGDQQAGQKLFQAKCAGCHTLAAAGSTGTVGPNLDDAFRADREQGFKQSTIANVVLLQIRQPAPPMPKNLVKGQSAQDVAAYVSSVAGQGSESSASPQQLGTDGKKIFSAECSSCHTLKAAAATGTVGPNLDQAKPPLSMAVLRVTTGGGAMPSFKGQLSTKQIADVTAYVVHATGGNPNG